MQGLTARLTQQFHDAFGNGGAIHIIRAPGRVNLIGEHTDYNDGFVFPMAIEPQVIAVCRARNDGQVQIASTYKPGEKLSFSVQSKIEKGEPSWGNYFKGVAALLREAGMPLVGMDLLLDNSLPVGGGLSSSAAIELAASLAMLKLAGVEMDRPRLALICQQVEHQYVGLPCGIMDQMIVAAGKANHAMLLDCRDLSQRFVPIDGNELRVVIINSMVKHTLSGSEYPERRAACESGVKTLQKTHPTIKALRDVTMKQLEAAKSQLSDVIYRRCRHVITENERTTKAADFLAKRQYEQAGKLMNESHVSMKNDFEITTAELDYLAETAASMKGVYGSRMTGGGFGGCTVSLVQPRHVEAFTESIAAAYQKKFNVTPSIFSTAAAAGASVIA